MDAADVKPEPEPRPKSRAERRHPERFAHGRGASTARAPRPAPRAHRRLVIALRFTTTTGEVLERDHFADRADPREVHELTITPTPPAWLEDGPPDWVEPGTAHRDWPSPASPITLSGVVTAGREADARRALGLGPA